MYKFQFVKVTNQINDVNIDGSNFTIMFRFIKKGVNENAKQKSSQNVERFFVDKVFDVCNYKICRKEILDM